MMNFQQYFNDWVQGDVVQAKVMIGITIFLCIPFIWFSARSVNSFLKGTIIPAVVLSLVFLSYGTYLLVTKSKEIPVMEKMYSEDAAAVLQKEKERTAKDSRSYVAFRAVWLTVFFISGLLYFLISGTCFKGFSSGCMILFFSLFITDSCFHSRLKTYRAALETQ